jgi:hypothetical protein
MIPNRQFGAGRVGMTTTLSSTVAAIVLIQAQIYLRLYPPCSQWDRTNRHSGEMFKPRWSTPRFPPSRPEAVRQDVHSNVGSAPVVVRNPASILAGSPGGPMFVTLT